MPQSYIEYNSGLTGTTFSVPFKYISINDVKALGFDGSSYTALTISQRSASEDTVTLAAVPSAYTVVRLYRSTSTTQLVDFQNGSRLSEADLDTAYQQGLFAAQEIAEDASTSQFAAVAAAAIQSGTSLSNFSNMEIAADGTDGLIDGLNAVYDISALNPQTSVPAAYRVSIDGVMQSPVSAYSLTINPAKITFSEAPPVGAKIVVVSAASAASAVSVDNVTIGLTSGNQAEIKDSGVSTAKIAADAVETAKIKDANVTFAKLTDVLDEDTMSSDSDTSLATQQSIKAYVDSKGITETTGSAPYFGVRAWANYNGTSDTLNASGNIASVVRNITGNYTFTFTTAMPDANYSLTMSYTDDVGPSGHGVGYIESQTTTAFTVRIFDEDNSGTRMNKHIVNISVIR